MPRETPGASSALREKLASEIRGGGPIPFARFMEIALYDPEHGYYASGPSRLGTRGDYFTASDVGTAFGEGLAAQLREMDACLGRPAPFGYLEVGCGRGLLARDVLDALAADADDGGGLRRRIRMTLVDSSAGMRQAAAGRAPRARVAASLEGVRLASGCGIAIEWFDALPVHRVRRRSARLLEVRVGLDAHGDLANVETEPSPEVREHAERYRAAARDGEEAEVQLAAGEAMDRLCRSIDRGFLIVVDYGDRSEALHHPSRAGGTLLAYRGHRTSNDLLAHVGEQDLTAHVNFSVLEDRASAAGWSVAGYTTQDRFLIANGLLRRFESEGGDFAEPSRVKRRLQAMQLIHPEGMGRIFKVLVLHRGLDRAPALEGLVDPFPSSRPRRS